MVFCDSFVIKSRKNRVVVGGVWGINKWFFLKMSYKVLVDINEGYKVEFFIVFLGCKYRYRRF